MRIFLLFFIVLVCLVSASYAQPADAAVIINQRTLNGFFGAIGPISGKGQ